ncbi:MAG: polyprenyl synthetase family protein [Myxococcota bacterium]|nr:polyprenyl synthetase family protein [Myxococcota bacterium]
MIRASADTAPSTPAATTERHRSKASDSARISLALSRAASSEGLLGRAVDYHLARPGKLARARLALAAGRALNHRPEAVEQFAVSCELLHNASLVHDDLQDRDLERRGQPTVWHRFGDAMAVNLGDHLLTRALEQAATVEAPGAVRGRLVRAVSAAVHTTLLGQTDDVSSCKSPLRTPEAYLRMARAKTGPLLALPVEGALILAEAAPELGERVRDAMSAFGAAYQIQDDLIELFDLEGRGEATGDLARGRPNAAAVYFLAGAAPEEAERLLRLLESSPVDANQAAPWVRRIRASPAIDAALRQLDTLRARGQACIDTLPPRLRGVVEGAAARMLDPTRTMRLHALRPASFGRNETHDGNC